MGKRKFLELETGPTVPHAGKRKQQPWPGKTTAARCQKSILDSVHGTESLELREAVLETPAHAEEKIKE
jgi:hypothetical protein